MEERVQEIEEQLCKLDSDKCVVEVRFDRRVCVFEVGGGGGATYARGECEWTVSLPAGPGV